MKRIAIFICIIFICELVQSQKTVITETGDVISEYEQLPGYNSYELTANYYVEFLEGFGYLPTSGNYMVAKTSPLSFDILETGTTGGSELNDEGGVVGSIEGAFTVSQTGAAVYSVSIKIPAGTSGMAPELALVYNSQFDDGYLGEKWSLSGISAITLTSKNMYFDGMNQAVELPQGLGPFLLDGMRLLEVATTNNTTEYKTEINNMSKIIGDRSSDTETVSYFIVYTKSGLIYEYGLTENSKYYLKDNNENKCPIAWYVNKISDRFSNYIEFEYYQDELNGELMIKEIRYTGNDDLDKPCYNRIEFNYDENRSNIIETIYKANFTSPVTNYLTAKITKYLTRIKCYTINDAIYRDYIITYNSHGMLGEQHIEKIYEKVSDELFYNPLLFEWELEEDEYSITQVESYGDFKQDDPNILITTGDFNADGKSDLLNAWLDDDEIYKFRVSYNSFGSGNSFDTKEINELAQSPENIYVFDFDANDCSDIIVKYAYNSYEYYYINKNENYAIIGGFPIFDYIPEPADETNLFFGDFNGDGINDCLIEVRNESAPPFGESVSFIITWGQSSGIPSTYITSGIYIDNKISYVVDINGDGKSEILCQREAVDSFFLIEVDNDQFNYIDFSLMLGIFTNETKLHFGDFNGDRKTDILKVNWGDNWTIFQGYGDGFKDGITLSVENIEFDIFYPGDFNGDGRTDLMVSPNYAAGGSWIGVKIWLANTDGKAFTAVPINIDENPIIHSDTRLIIGDFDGNGRSDFFSCEGDNADPEYYFYGIYGNNNNLITSITNGTGDKFEMLYKPIIQYDVYSQQIPLMWKSSKSLTHPISNFTAPIYVVKQIYHEHINGHTKIDYKYYDARTHRYGKGFLGFMVIDKKNIDDGLNSKNVIIREYYDYDDTFYYVYSCGQNVYLEGCSSGDKLSSSFSTIDFKINSNNEKVFFPFPLASYSRTWERDVEDNYEFIKSIKTERQFDDYGNLSYMLTYNSNVNYDEGMPDNSLFDNSFKEELINEYKAPDEVNWILGRLETATVTSHIPDPNVPDITHSSDFEYYNNGMLWKETFLPSNPKSVTKEYFYDDYGNIWKTVNHAQNMQDRVFETYYDTDLPESQRKGRFLTLSVNGKGHQESKVYDQVKGVVLEITDPNLLTTHYEYDAFGNLVKTTDATGFESVTVNRWADGSDTDTPASAVCLNWTKSSGIPELKTYFDSQGKKLREVTVGFNGTKIYTDYGYDYHQFLSSVSDPYFKNSSPVYSTFTYDFLGRKKTITLPGNRISTIDYKGLTTETVNPLGQLTKKVVNELGWIIKNYDATEQNYVEFKYYSDGSVWKKYINNHPETEIVKTYDVFGNCDHVEDPALGVIDYEYNAYCEVTKKTKNGVIISNNMIYDVLGRLASYVEPADDRYNYFYFDTGENGIGKLDYEEVKNYSEQLIHRISYNYDQYGRIEDKTETIKVEGSDENYVTGYQYDIFSRIKKLIYPSGFSTTLKYNQYGYLGKIIRDYDQKTVWQLMQMNARQQIMAMHYGNGLNTINEYFPNTGFLKSIKTNKLGVMIQDVGYSWDAIGNLLQRNKIAQTGNFLQEDFQYDEHLNRLRQIDVDYYTGTATIEMNYDDLGRIQYKRSTNPLFHTANNYIYEGDGDENPYNLFRIDNVPALYNVNGLDQNLTYTKFDKLSHITQENKQLDLIYGLGHNRIIQTITYPGYSQTKIYVGGNYEKIIENGTTREIHYIAGGSGVCAIFTKKSNGTNEFVYTHLDHLGSIEALTDETGLLVEEYSYDTWGLRRDPNNWVPYDETQTLQTDRGFTGHEHLDLFALVNMNGRVYDPVLGYFLSPDPFSQFPNYTQGFNRYSYCLNNPLSFNDPSGYFSCPSLNFSTEEVIQAFATVVVTAMAIIVTIETAGLGTGIGGAMIGGALGGFTAGYGMTMINGGSFNDCIAAGLQGAVFGALSAGLTYGIGEAFGSVFKTTVDGTRYVSLSNELGRTVAHGTIQGTIRVAQGGRFEQGFFAGAVSSLSGSLTQFGFSTGANVLIGATLGGTAEALAGGKFANGAITGAFVVLFNHLQHNPGGKDVKELNKTIKVDSYEEMRKMMREMSSDYDAEIAGASVEIDGITEYYILPAHVDGDFTNTGIYNKFDRIYLPSGTLKAIYHTHLTYYQPHSRMDSYNAWLYNVPSYIFTPNATWQVVPHHYPIKTYNDDNYYSKFIGPY